MMMADHDAVEPEKNAAIRLVKKFYPVSTELDGNNFFTTLNGAKAVTPLFVALIIIETTDVMFAVDSIPAIFAVTTDAFIVFTSNVFAILGLRSLYFVLASMIDKFRYLQMSLVFVLAFVGVKMLLVHHFKFPVYVSLTVIIGILAVGIIASLIANKRHEAPTDETLEEEKVSS
jgi:tellurite resistance protein TerC